MGFIRKKRVLASIVLLAITFIALLTFLMQYEPKYTVKTAKAIGSGTKHVPKRITLKPNEKKQTVTSPVYEADFAFNALTPYWEEKLPEDSHRKFFLRVSDDAKKWSEWIEVATEGAVRDDEPNPQLTYIESPLFIEGKHFQYRLELNRESLDEPTPSVSNITLAYLDSRKPKHLQALDSIRSFTKAYAAERGPNIISRAEWGSPDPDGESLKGQNNYWEPTYKAARQVFIHHTVNSNYNADPAAVVRGIYHFHTYTRGWGDIGYNYILDHNGTVYEGRFGGDNVVAGHVYEYNAGSLGVAMIGCYDSTSDTCKRLNGGNVPGPSAAMWSSLTSLLSWKTTNLEIDPLATQSFCKYNGTGCLTLSTIAGHKDANLTSCPGNGIYNNLQNVRAETDYKNKNDAWNYSARQDSYTRANLSGSSDTVSVTMRFKNTGKTTWSNTTNRLTLKTTVPAGRLSHFQADGWVDANTPAILTEPTVRPGESGSFTFNLKRPPLAYGTYPEYLKLTAEGVGDIKAHFNVPVDVYCTLGQLNNPRADGTFLRNADSGAMYVIAAGKRRYIPSGLAAASQGYSLDHYINVPQTEIDRLTSGAPLTLSEGTLLKVHGSPHLFVLDETSTGTNRHWISSAEAMRVFGMGWGEVLSVSQSFMDEFPEGGPITASSPIPDGRVIKTDGQDKLYIVKEATSRWITTPTVLNSYGLGTKSISTVSPAKLNELASGSNLQHLRTGSLMQAPGSSALYVSDVTLNSSNKRLITDIKSYYYSGLFAKPIFSQPQATLDTYTDASELTCHL